MQQLKPQQNLTQGNPGPKTIICGAMHGDERLGVQVIEQLQKQLPEQELFGEVLLLIANTAAYAANTRFIDVDMNRLWHADSIATLQSKLEKNTEEARVLEIVPHVQQVDYLLDIHCTGKPTKHPFIYCEATEKHLALADVFAVDKVLSPASYNGIATMNSCFDNYIDAMGGIGLTIEAGWLKDDSLLDATLQSTMHALGVTGNVPAWKPEHAPAPKPRLSVFEEVIATSDAFVFDPHIENFSKLEKGACYARDNEKEVVAEEGCCVIFPKRDIYKGGVACYLAREV